MTYDLNTNDELIERYIDGTLEAGERERVALLISQDAEWEGTYLQMKNAVELVRHAALTQQVTLAGERFEQQRSFQPVHKQKPSTRPMKYVLRVAAAAVVIVASYTALLYGTTTSDKLFADSYVPYELTTSRSNERSIQAEQLYKAANWNQLLQTVKVDSYTSAKEIFLSAIAALNLSRYTEAEARFRAVTERTAESSHLDDAEYYLALTLIKTGKLKEAQSLFGKIKDDPSHKYYYNVNRMNMLRLNMLEWKK